MSSNLLTNEKAEEDVSQVQFLRAIQSPLASEYSHCPAGSLESPCLNDDGRSKTEVPRNQARLVERNNEQARLRWFCCRRRYVNG